MQTLITATHEGIIVTWGDKSGQDKCLQAATATLLAVSKCTGLVDTIAHRQILGCGPQVA